MAGQIQHRVRPRSIRRLIGLWLLFAVVPLLLVQAGIYYRRVNVERRDELQANLEMARAVAAAFSFYLQEVRDEQWSIGHALAQSMPPAGQQGNTLLAEAARRHPGIRSLSWVDPRGRVVASSVAGLVGQDWSPTSWFRELAAGREWKVTSAVRSRDPRQMTFSVAQAIRDAGGTLRGMVVAVIDPEGLRSSLDIKRSGGAAFSLIDSSGWLVYRRPSGSIPWEQRDWGKLYPPVGGALRGRETSAPVLALHEHRQRDFAGVPILSTGWVASASRPEEEVISPVLWDTAVLLIITLFALVVVMAAATVISGPLRRLRRHAVAVGEGDFARRLEACGPAELADLAEAFNQMARQLQLREHEHERLLELERERAREARLLDAIVENTQAHLVYLDRDFNFIWVNSAYARACRRSREDFIGHSHFEFYPHAENQAIFERVRDTGQPAEFREKPFEFPDQPDRGITYWDWTLTAVKDDQGVVEGLIFSLADVTEKVRTREQMLAAERARVQIAETVAAEINHRMKNNLALVSGMLQMQAGAQPAGSPAADALRQAVARLSALSVVHEQLLEARSERLELMGVVRRIGEIATAALASGSADLSVTGSPAYAAPGVGSAIAVVANELITNAVKHGAAGPGQPLRVEVDLSRVEGKLHLSVWNSGRPVPPDFDLAAGSGMGLRLAQGVAVGQLKGSLILRPHRGGTLSELIVDDSILETGVS